VSPHARVALAQLCGTYWKPLYAFIRRSGCSTEESQDLTQEFFARLLEKNYLQTADRERGRFRSFLLGAVKHFLANQRKAARTQKRGGGEPLLSLDFSTAEAAYLLEPADLETPQRLFDRQWALVLLDQVMRQLESEFAGAGKVDQFAALRPFLSAGEDHAAAYRDVGVKLGLSEAAVKMAMHRLRKRFREALRAEIAQTVVGPEEINDELAELFAVLAKKSG
jgi:RNA polymerase sigma-70 factor (ECF subfamily)